MPVALRQVHIENFRSIQRITVPLNKLSVLVGKNDCGKSNVLRALNLFFNSVTNPGVPFNFDTDYNFFVPDKAKTAKEVVVRIELDIPWSYQATNGNIIVWEKRWRTGGLHLNQYWGVRLSKNRLQRENREQFTIPDKSNAHALLRQIEFEYVPAIKDSRYFDDLRGRIYSIISEVATRTFRTSSSAFEDSIGEHLADLTQEIAVSLGLQTRLALPRDLSHIFQRLDFLSGSKGVSLDSRGDGIKTRHIPHILKFMAEKKRSLQGRGAAPYSFIWAYEEPENNLEFASAVELAFELSQFALNEIAQILLTTHSPVFYDLHQTNPTNVTCAHVFRDTDEQGTECSLTAGEIDEKMGTMTLLAPRVKQLVQEVREQVQAKHDAEKLAEQNRPKIFVEGESDRIVLQRCAQLFHPQRSANVDFETKISGAGHSYVIDMLNAWRCQHKHHPQHPRAAGILDGDANEQRKAWNAGKGNVESSKAFCYEKPAHLIAAIKDGFRLQATLEVIYPDYVWAWAEKQGMLEDSVRADVYPVEMTQKMLKGELKYVELNEIYRHHVTRQFLPSSKITCAKYVANLPDAKLLKDFSSFGALLGNVLDYLES